MRIPDFNELPAGNPVTAIDLHTRDGLILRFELGEVQQSRVMWAIGGMLAELGAPLEITLPEVAVMGQSEVKEREANKQ